MQDLTFKNLETATISGEPYLGSISVGDTLEFNGVSYAVLGINEDGIVVKELK